MCRFTAAAGLAAFTVLGLFTTPLGLGAELPLSFHGPVLDKNFLVLSELMKGSAVREALLADQTLSVLATQRSAREAPSPPFKRMGAGVQPLDGFLWTDAEIGRAREALMSLYGSSAAMRRLVDGHLRSSGCFERYRTMSGERLLGQAWEDAARAINRIIQVYGDGVSPRYPLIDSVSYDPKDDSYRKLLGIVAAVLADGRSARETFFEPSLDCALYLLSINRRDEAARFEPLAQGENAPAIRALAGIDWGHYPFSVILVPGAGSVVAGVPLSPWAKMRLSLAVRRFREQKAPLLLVSGGFVHPAQTPYCEAVEMKRSLIKDYGLPERVILIEPFARHTTTNLRNADREIIRYGLPALKPVLVVTDPGQGATIASAAFGQRCDDELGYRPYQKLVRISAFDLSFLPVPDSLQADARDPLDP
jgi:hypothetical protein